MRRSVLLLVFGVLLPGSLSPLLYRLLPERRAPAVRAIEIAPLRLEVVAPRSAPVADEDTACRVSAVRSQELWGGATDRLRARAGAGSLRVVGVEGLDRIRVRAVLCASDLARISAMDVEVRRMGPDVTVETAQPDPDGAPGWSDDEYARIDLVVEVPRGIPTAIEDGSGPLTVTGVGDLSIRDGSGAIEVRDVAGDARIVDGSGSVSLDGVSGDVELEDGSGPVAVAGVVGSVAVDDASGDLEVSVVGGSVRIRLAVPGAVSVREVGGDLVVLGDGGAAVRHHAVRGRVSIGGRRP